MLMQELTRTIIGNSTDSPHVYRLAFESARAAGLSRTDQIRFAGVVVDLFFISHSAEGTLTFGVKRNSENEYILQAILENTSLSIETTIPRAAGEIVLNSDNTLSDYELMHQRYIELEQRNRDMQQFTFSVSHELKNSLTKLKLATSLLETDTEPDLIQKHIQIMQRSAKQLEETLLGLNEIIHFRHINPIAKPVSLAEVFSRVEDELEEKLAAANASVSTDFDDIDGWSYVEVYLKSIFSNLLSNSIKYASANRKPEISIKAMKHGPDVVLNFTDNGQGIDIDRHGKNIFLPFARFSTNKQEGKGLGLYIIKSMIERNGGHIEIDSQLEKGTTFRMRLRSY
ncbi:MAG: HAMP domain-containing histidine kinase [Chitinophagaceae bacterium]|nr:MAG: HAMP domain-containing histidine kinase [Chitinophagaceae bacterium]